MPFMVGQSVGDYVVVGAAAPDNPSGGYIVEHTITRRREAMRILGNDGHCAVQDVDRFFTGIRHQASLSHPNIAGVHNAFWAGDALVMVYELVEGESLQTLLAQRPLPLLQSLDVMTAVLRALAYAHANGVRHCAIEPSRILVSRDGGVKLLNPAIAPALDQPHSTREEANEQNDLVACGITFHQLITGVNPDSPQASRRMLRERCDAAVQGTIGANPRLVEELNAIIVRAVATAPGAGFPSAEAFLEAVSNLRQALQAALAAPPRIQAPRLWIGLAAGFACTLILVASVMKLNARQDVRSPQPAITPIAKTATPVPPPALPAPVKPKPNLQPLVNRHVPPPPSPLPPPAPKRKNPVVRFAGAIKRLNPIARRDRQPPQTQPPTNSPALPEAANPAGTSQ